MFLTDDDLKQVLLTALIDEYERRVAAEREARRVASLCLTEAITANEVLAARLAAERPNGNIRVGGRLYFVQDGVLRRIDLDE